MPQGLVIGLILYLIYGNDLPSNREDQNPVTYIDDHCDTVGATSEEELEEKLQQEAEKTENWMYINLMCLSKSKTKLMIVASNKPRRKFPEHDKISVSMEGEQIEQTSYSKHLGQILENNLKWS